MTLPAPSTDRLDAYLRGLRWRVDDGSRVQWAAGDRRSLPAGVTSFAYVRSGALSIRLGAGGTHCRELVAGDLLLHTGRSAVALEAEDEAEGVLVRLRSTEVTPGFATLPSPLVIGDFATIEPAIAQLAGSMGCDGASSRHGDSVVCAQIATTVITVAMRTWLERGCAPDSWLGLLGDPQIADVLRVMHDDPGSAWNLTDLAGIATMSRTVFAERFREAVGASPAQYLAGVRMTRAMDRLSGSAVTVSALSHDLGYASEEGFRRAFRRHTGSTPTQWRRQQAA